jgi:hypothetical protein
VCANAPGAAADSGVGTLGLPLVGKIVVDAIFAVFPLILLAALFAFFALFATVAHDVLLSD